LSKRSGLTLAFTLLMVLVGLFALWSLLWPLTIAKGNVRIVVQSGSSFSEVADALVREKVVASSLNLKVLAGRSGADKRVLPGEYQFRRGMSYTEALDVLRRGPIKKVFTVVIPEGFTIDQIADRLKARTEVDAEEFRRLAKEGRTSDHASSALWSYDFLESNPGSSLEGYLFPKTYRIDEDTTADEFLNRLLAQFEKETSSLDWSVAKARNLTVYEVVTVASLIEKEAKIPEERSLIAAVIYNRLQMGMPLQIDATVQYILPMKKTGLTEDDLKTASPYNTYLQLGLPPGPICNPGLACLKAALNPAEVDYLYYVLTDSDGRHAFTSSYEDFVKAKQEAKKGLK